LNSLLFSQHFLSNQLQHYLLRIELLLQGIPPHAPKLVDHRPLVWTYPAYLRKFLLYLMPHDVLLELLPLLSLFSLFLSSSLFPFLSLFLSSSFSSLLPLLSLSPFLSPSLSLLLSFPFLFLFPLFSLFPFLSLFLSSSFPSLLPLLSLSPFLSPSLSLLLSSPFLSPFPLLSLSLFPFSLLPFLSGYLFLVLLFLCYILQQLNYFQL